MTALVAARGLTRVHGSGPTAVTALAGVDLDVERGTLLVVRGRSGAGKTTLLTLLSGLDTPTAGTVALDGQDLGTLAEPARVDLRRRRIGIVFASFALLAPLTAAENVGVPLRLVRTPVAQREETVARLLAEVGLTGHAGQRPDQLSGGQQQRVAVARALANDPDLLLADEPTAQLDSENGAAVMALIRRLVHDRGMTAVVTTHDPLVVAVADAVVDLSDGRVAAGRTGRRPRHVQDADDGASQGETG